MFDPSEERQLEAAPELYSAWAPPLCFWNWLYGRLVYCPNG